MYMFIKRYQEHKRYLSKKPEKILWIFPLICNLRCNHCDIGKLMMVGKGGKPSDGLILKENKKIIDRLSKWIGKPYSLSFIAGEPLMHEDMLETVKYATERGAVTSLTSNGTLIQNLNIAEKIVKSKLEYMALSLDSMNAKIHDQSRGVLGTHQKVMKAVELLQEAKSKLKSKTPKIYINAIIMKENLDEIRNMIKWSKKAKVDGITFQPIASKEFFSSKSEYGGRWYVNNPVWPAYKDVINLIDYMEEMKQNGYPLQNSEGDFIRFRQYFKNPETFGKMNVCVGSLGTLVISPKGKASVCMSEALGDILTDDLDQIWFSQQSEKAKRRVSKCEAQCKILACNKDDFYF